MIELLKKEMIVQGIIPLGKNTYQWNGQNFSFDQLKKQIASSEKKHKTLLFRLWTELAEQVSKRESGESCLLTCSIFVPAIQSLYALANSFPELQKNGVASSLKDALQQDSSSFSRLVMSKVVDFRLAIDWMHHLVRRDIYLRKLVSYYIQEMKKQQTAVAGASTGPWSNVDLPMNERVVPWEDMQEDIEETTKDKQNQSRYRMGLENYGNGDFSSNEGFVFREFRNEPYSFEDDDSNPYPHRNTLWV